MHGISGHGFEVDRERSAKEKTGERRRVPAREEIGLKQDGSRKSLIGLGLLLLTACVWGFGFVAQSIGADYVGPYTFLAMRSWIAFFVLFPVIRFLDVFSARREGTGEKESKPEIEVIKHGRQVWIAGIVCGIFLFLGSALQQVGIAYTTAAKAGFLTAMYVVIVPVIYAIIKRGIGIKIWISVVLAVIGLYLLCITGGFALARGDAIVLACALFYSIQILLVDRFVPRIDPVRLSQIQFLVVSLFSTVLMLVFEKPALSDLGSAFPAILYAGLISSGVGYTLQTVGQTMVSPTVGGITMSLESVFAAIGGWLILHELLTKRELTGCAVMMAAIILAQIPLDRLAGRRRRETRG